MSGGAVRAALAQMPPAYFALVMATGIVAIACDLAGPPQAAAVLLPLNGVFYAVLWGATLARVLLYPGRVLADLGDHGRGIGSFTAVAATCVLGAQVLVAGGPPELALGLWYVGVVLWVLLTYGVLTALTVRRDKPDLVQGLNGGWLLAIVATQSVVVLGAQLAPTLGERGELVLFALLALWLGGGMLYFWIISLIFYRYTFFPLSPADLTPPYWINMGAAAITTLAGSILAMQAEHAPVLVELAPFVKGFTLFFWASATWWIPMLVLLGFWRHVLRRFPLTYHPLYWGAVFPLGMYATCTYRLAGVLEVPALEVLPRGFVWIALGAWLVVFAGMLRSLARLLVPLAATR